MDGHERLMPLVKGPNGLVVDVPDSVASGLVGDGKRGFEYVDEKPEPPKRTRAKADSFKNRK